MPGQIGGGIRRSQRKESAREQEWKDTGGKRGPLGTDSSCTRGPEQMKQKPPEVLECYLRVISNQSTVVTIQDALNLMTQGL